MWCDGMDTRHVTLRWNSLEKSGSTSSLPIRNRSEERKIKDAQSGKSTIKLLVFNHIDHLSLAAALCRNRPSPQSKTSLRTLLRCSLIWAHVLRMLCINLSLRRVITVYIQIIRLAALLKLMEYCLNGDLRVIHQSFLHSILGT